jgi:hypothetical protein
MEERFKPSTLEEAKTKIMISLPRKEALDEKERGTLLLIKMLRILDNREARPRSKPITEGENSNINKNIQTKFWVSFLGRKTIENLA